MNWDPGQNSQFFRCFGFKSIASATCWMDMSTDERLARILWQKSQPRGDWSNALLLDEASWKNIFFCCRELFQRKRLLWWIAFWASSETMKAQMAREWTWWSCNSQTYGLYTKKPNICLYRRGRPFVLSKQLLKFCLPALVIRQIWVSVFN